MTAAKRRLDATPQLFPENEGYLEKLCKNIRSTGSASFHELRYKMPDSRFSFDGTAYVSRFHH